MKNTLYALLMIASFSACKKEAVVPETTTEIIPDTVSVATVHPQKSPVSQYRDTLQINYKENKDLLDILTVLPDSSMASWGWPQKERKEFVQFISKNNFTVDTTENFMTIKKFKLNTLNLQIVDGTWTLSIYKVKPQHYIVITNDIVGDGNDLQSYEYNTGKINSIPLENLFGKYLKALLIDENNSSCIEVLQDNEVTFDINLNDAKKIELQSFYITKKEQGNCLKGNTLEYEFNPTTKKFNLNKITWVENKK